MMTRKVIATLVGALSLAACAPDSSNAAPVAVELANDRVTLGSAELAAGRVACKIENESPDLVYECKVFAGGTEGAFLSVSNSVADTAGLDLVDEVEDIVP